MPKISLIMASRVNGNKNHGLSNFIQSLNHNYHNPENFELLIKFDDDDDTNYIQDIMKKHINNCPYRINYIITSRRRGYEDLHLHYAELMPLVSDDSYIIGAVADDFIVTEKNWDKVVIDKIDGNKDIKHDLFIVHGHKPDIEIIDLNNLEGAICDESPFWSKRLLQVCSNNWMIYATDAWTVALEKCMSEKDYNNVVWETGVRIFQRKFNPNIDSVSAPRFYNERKRVFDFTKTKYFQHLIKKQSWNIHLDLERQYGLD